MSKMEKTEKETTDANLVWSLVNVMSEDHARQLVRSLRALVRQEIKDKQKEPVQS